MKKERHKKKIIHKKDSLARNKILKKAIEVNYMISHLPSISNTACHFSIRKPYLFRQLDSSNSGTSVDSRTRPPLAPLTEEGELLEGGAEG